MGKNMASKRTRGGSVAIFLLVEKQVANNLPVMWVSYPTDLNQCGICGGGILDILEGRTSWIHCHIGWSVRERGEAKLCHWLSLCHECVFSWTWWPTNGICMDGMKVFKSAVEAAIACGHVMPIKGRTNDSGTWFILEEHPACHHNSWWEVITRCAQLLEVA